MREHISSIWGSCGLDQLVKADPTPVLQVKRIIFKSCSYNLTIQSSHPTERECVCGLRVSHVITDQYDVFQDARLKGHSVRGLNPAFTRSLPLLADRSLSHTPAEYSVKIDRRDTDLDSKHMENQHFLENKLSFFFKKMPYKLNCSMWFPFLT